MAIPAAAPATGTRRVAIVASAGEALRHLETALLAQIAGLGHRLLVIAPEFSNDDVSALDEVGSERELFPVDPPGLKLFSDWKGINTLKSTLAAWNPHVVLGCGSKPMVYAALAAEAAEVERVVVLIDSLPQNRFAGALAADEMPAWRYGQALRAASEAVFYNRDDIALLRRLGLVPPDLQTHVVAGAGIDLEKQPLQDLPPLTQGLVFLMIAPLDRRKGVVEYCKAAAEVQARAPNTRFILAGASGKGPLALTAEELETFGGAVEYVGNPADTRELIASCHIFVYPAHSEGMPQRVLEAMAAGRPIITTDVAGCRDTVDERVNGCLVPAGDATALAAAVESFLKRPDLIPPIARASRMKAERFCGIDTVNRSMLAALGLE